MRRNQTIFGGAGPSACAAAPAAPSLPGSGSSTLRKLSTKSGQVQSSAEQIWRAAVQVGIVDEADIWRCPEDLQLPTPRRRFGVNPLTKERLEFFRTYFP